MAPTDDDLPGMWSHADFEGGDPDERSYAERNRDLGADAVSYWPVAGLAEIQAKVNADLVRLVEAQQRGYITPEDMAIDAGFMEEPVGYDGFGAPLYQHQIPPEGTE